MRTPSPLSFVMYNISISNNPNYFFLNRRKWLIKDAKASASRR